jgi:hypothetical protein
MNGEARRDLAVLVADKNMEFALGGLLTRHRSMGIRPVTFTIYRHPERDPGCFRFAHDLMRSSSSNHAHALVMFDREGCGREDLTRGELEQKVEARLAQNGWNDRAVAIVLDPELEVWVWSDSPHVDAALGWEGQHQSLRTWLVQNGFANTQREKPMHPKEAVERVLRLVRKPRSSSIYRQLANGVDFEACTDQAFVKFRATLRNWFTAEGPRQNS